MFVIPSHVILCCGLAWRCAYSSEQAQLYKLIDAFAPGKACSRWKLAPSTVEFALRVVPRLHGLHSSLKDVVRLARAMSRVVVGYAPNPALPEFSALFSRLDLKEMYDLVVAAHSVLAPGSTPDAERRLG
jgi:hypothetical protein